VGFSKRFIIAMRAMSRGEVSNRCASSASSPYRSGDNGTSNRTCFVFNIGAEERANRVLATHLLLGRRAIEGWQVNFFLGTKAGGHPPQGQGAPKSWNRLIVWNGMETSAIACRPLSQPSPEPSQTPNSVVRQWRLPIDLSMLLPASHQHTEQMLGA
jgi:hypothetical protein